jgi:hypothetical protein
MTQVSSPFVEIDFSKLSVCEVEGYGRKMAKSVHIVCSDKRIVIRLDDLSKLLSLLEVRGGRRAGVDAAVEAAKSILGNRDFVIHARKVDKLDDSGRQILIAYAVATKEFKPIPHKPLFDFVESELANAGLLGGQRIVRRYKARTVAYIPIANSSYAVAVSNANTSRDAVRVYDALIINGIPIPIASEFHKTMHRADEVEIMKKAAEYAMKIAAKHAGAKIKLKPIIRRDVERFIDMAEKIFPRRYALWFAKLRNTKTSEELLAEAASITDRIAKQRGAHDGGRGKACGISHNSCPGSHRHSIRYSDISILPLPLPNPVCIHREIPRPRCDIRLGLGLFR